MWCLKEKNSNSYCSSEGRNRSKPKKFPSRKKKFPWGLPDFLRMFCCWPPPMWCLKAKKILILTRTSYYQGHFANAWIWDLKVIYYHGCLWAFMGVPGRILVSPLLFRGKQKIVERISRLCWDKTNWNNGNSKILKENWRNIIIKSAE